MTRAEKDLRAWAQEATQMEIEQLKSIFWVTYEKMQGRKYIRMDLIKKWTVLGDVMYSRF